MADSVEVIVVGSQSILGQFPDAPAECLISNEADIYPADDPEKSILIDGAIGENSIFHETFGYYAHGVAADTAILPNGYDERLIPVRNENTKLVTGWCLEIHDLAASKLAAGREKDLEFVRAIFAHKLVETDILQQRIKSLPDKSEIAVVRLAGLISKLEVATGFCSDSSYTQGEGAGQASAAPFASSPLSRTCALREDYGSGKNDSNISMVDSLSDSTKLSRTASTSTRESSKGLPPSLS